VADEQVVKLIDGEEFTVEAEGVAVECFRSPRGGTLIVMAVGDSSLFVTPGATAIRRGTPEGKPGLFAFLDGEKDKGVIRYGAAAAAVRIEA